MKPRLLILILAGLSAVVSLHAQWLPVTYSLKGGWNGIFLHGDVPQSTLDEIFAGSPEVQEVWRWNTNPTQTQFQTNSLVPTQGTPDWTKWVRGSSMDSTLSRFSGQCAYLIKCSGTTSDSYSFSLLQKAVPPKNTWVRNGANLLGFPSRLTGSNYPTFTNYFSGFSSVINSPATVYRYIGGDLSTANPMQVFSLTFDRVDRNQAYWFDATVVESFTAPLEVSVDPSLGLDFGRSGSTATVHLRNRTKGALTVTLASVASAAAPTGQDSIIGSVPLTTRSYDSATSSYVETALPTSGLSVAVAALSSVDITFGVDRSGMSAPTQSTYASLLRVTDSAGLVDVNLPVTAINSNYAGLWLGDVAVSGVVSKVPGSPGETTTRAYPLRVILHVDNTGTARLLSQVFIGQLSTADNPIGVCVREDQLLATAKASATRYVATHLPLDQVLTGSGGVALGSSLSGTVILNFDNPTNPFVHTYHPDHDNKDATFTSSLAAGVESYTITRVCTFAFASQPPSGVSGIGWGTKTLAGNYTEIISGLHKEPLTVHGTFTLHRASELGDLLTQ